MNSGERWSYLTFFDPLNSFPTSVWPENDGKCRNQQLQAVGATGVTVAVAGLEFRQSDGGETYMDMSGSSRRTFFPKRQRPTTTGRRRIGRSTAAAGGQRRHLRRWPSVFRRAHHGQSNGLDSIGISRN